MNRTGIFNKITESIIAKLNDDIIPWRKSWKRGLPTNYVSNRPYNGINFLSLCSMDFASPFFLTYLQCKAKNGYVNKGEHGSLVVFWKIEQTADISGRELISNRKVKPLFQYSYVYNISQTSLYAGVDESVKIISAERIISDLKVKPIIKNNIRGCFYNTSQDFISIPVINDFDSPEEYYSSLFHELIHWTAHKSRLGRDLSAEDENYSIEELTAELGSSYLCGLTGISSKVIENQTAYISGWLKTLSGDRQMILKASLAARKALEYLLHQADLK